MDVAKFKDMCRTSCGYWWILVVILAVLFFWKVGGVFLQIDRGSYQAVFLTNGQVYFGKLAPGFGGFLTLKDAHYLVAAPNQQQTGVPPVSLNILSVEIQPQTPVSTMYISKKQVLFWENLKADSPAIQVIGSQKAAVQQQ